MIDDSVIKKAIEFSNKLKKQTIECPRECLNPGLYFGYIAGYEQSQKKLQLALKQRDECLGYCKEILENNDLITSDGFKRSFNDSIIAEFNMEIDDE